MKLLLSGFDDSLKWGDALYVNSNAFPEAVAVISSDGSRKLYRSDGTVAEAKNGAPYFYLWEKSFGVGRVKANRSEDAQTIRRKKVMKCTLRKHYIAVRKKYCSGET